MLLLLLGCSLLSTAAWLDTAVPSNSFFWGLAADAAVAWVQRSSREAVHTTRSVCRVGAVLAGLPLLVS